MELRDRDALEEKFGARFGKIAARHGRELLSFLGNPPNLDNIPAEFWEKVEEEKQNEDALLLYLAMMLSARQHLDLVFSEDPLHSRLASLDRQRQTMRHMDAILEPIARAKAADNAQRFVDRSKEMIGHAIEKNELETRPKKGLRELRNRVFGPSRVERDIVTSITNGRALGGEKAMALTVGLHDRDLWLTVYGSGLIDKRVCPTCEMLNRTARSYWSRFFPEGPAAHESCRCEVGYALELSTASRRGPDALAAAVAESLAMPNHASVMAPSVQNSGGSLQTETISSGLSSRTRR
jgi:hypothetical protein